MKNLFDCHSKGLHSFPISLDNSLYRRIFYAVPNHRLWIDQPIEIAIHPHHADITITVLDGVLVNQLFERSPDGEEWGAYRWNSHILNGSGGFVLIGTERLIHTEDAVLYEGTKTRMKACDLHTVYVQKGKKCVWLIEEQVPSCEYFPINYSDQDLSRWSPVGLYNEVSQEEANKFIKPYLTEI